MKKIISVMLAFILIFSAISVSVTAADLCTNGKEHEWSEFTVVPASCTEKEYQTKECARCHQVYKKYTSGSEALGHLEDIRNNGDGTHTVYCKRANCKFSETKDCSMAKPVCGQIPVCDICNVAYSSKIYHNYKTVTIIQKATCLKDGKECIKCVDCGATEEKVIAAPGHEYEKTTVAPTCREQGYDLFKCKNCGENHKSNYQESLNHNKVLTGSIPPSCTYGGYNVYTCSRCLLEIREEVHPLGHDFVYQSNNDATCTLDGTKTGKCTRCPQTSTVTDEGSKLGHDFKLYISNNNATCTKNSTEWAACNRGCGAKDVRDIPNTALGHDMSGFVVTKAPTCTADGMQTDKCLRCALITTMTLPAKGHEKVLTSSITPSCTISGYNEYTCSRCSLEIREGVKPLGHKYISIIITAPTCINAGTANFKCENCGDTYTGEVVATGHQFDKININSKCLVCEFVCDHSGLIEAIPEVKATCTTEGSKNGYYCTDCGKVVIEPKKVDKLGHDIEVIKGIAPTCATAGKSDGQRCKRVGCDYKVDQVALAALGHSWSATKEIVKDSTCTAKGSKAIVCTREGCNTIKEGTIEEIAIKPHDYKAKAVTKEATCETAGEKAKVCRSCTAKTDIEVIKALGHDWDSGSVKIPADCTKDGVVTYKCKRTGCGKTEDRKVDKLEHMYKEVKVPATCEKDGYSTFTCTCGDEYIAKKVEKFGHSFIKYVQDKNTATCYKDGTKTALCDHGCGKKNTITDEGSKIDHKLTDFKTIKEATCTEEGEEEAKCFYFDKCGYSENYATDALGHTIDANTAYTVDVAATCTAAGSESKHCERCSHTEGSRGIPALGHTYPDNWSTILEPDCQNKGASIKVCFGCNDVISQTLPKTGHADLDGDSKCDTCEKTIAVVEPEKPSEPEKEPEEKPCDCNCHAGGIKAFFFNLVNFFAKIFDKNARVCACGKAH